MIRSLTATLLVLALAAAPLSAAHYRTHTGSVTVTTSNSVVTFTDNGSGGDGFALPAAVVVVYNAGPATVFVDCKDDVATAADTAIPVGTRVELAHNPSMGGNGFAACGLITSAGQATATVLASSPRKVGLEAGGLGEIFRPGDVELEVSASVAAAANNQTLTNAIGKRTYITGFSVTGGGATAGSIIAVTVTGLTTTMTFHFAVPAGVAVGATPLIVDFGRPIPASADNTAIVVNVPSFGLGNTEASATARGFRR